MVRQVLEVLYYETFLIGNDASLIDRMRDLLETGI